MAVKNDQTNDILIGFDSGFRGSGCYELSIQQESPSAFHIPGCPLSTRIPVRFAQELLSDFSKNACPLSAGIAVRFDQEYAVRPVGCPYNIYFGRVCIGIKPIKNWQGMPESVAEYHRNWWPGLGRNI